MKTLSIISWRIVIILILSFTQIHHSMYASMRPSPKDYVQVNGMKMYYEIHGSASSTTMPIIVLHGAYMSLVDMGDIIPKLAKTHKSMRSNSRVMVEPLILTGQSPIRILQMMCPYLWIRWA